MKTISIINLKGGVAKTISAANIAHILAFIHNKRVLLVDNDKQGNISKFFGIHSEEHPSIAELLTERDANIYEIITPTQYPTLDVIPANMTLISANTEILGDNAPGRSTRLKTALQRVTAEYDYCIIDNAPDFNASTVNALVASHDVLIPLKIDNFAFDGLAELVKQIYDIRDNINPELNLRGCFVVMYQNNDINRTGKEWLQGKEQYRLFNTHIRRTIKVDESTFTKKPIIEYSRRCGAAQDYIAFVAEYLENVSETDTKGGAENG